MVLVVAEVVAEVVAVMRMNNANQDQYHQRLQGRQNQKTHLSSTVPYLNHQKHRRVRDLYKVLKSGR